jgi:hypothetical protein
MSILKSALFINLSGHCSVQQWLEKFVAKLLNLVGIVPDTGVLDSGEQFSQAKTKASILC